MELFPEPKPDETADSILTVSELTDQIKAQLESTFPSIWVGGEVSNLSRPRSGHIYFTLKDEQAQIPAVIWRSTAGGLKFEMENGLQVVCRGGLDVYAPHGAYKFMVRRVEPHGQGALELAFRQLHERLAREGLFDSDLKKPLPAFPRRVVIVTSPTGAAVRDFIETAHRRWPVAAILVIPAKVQGSGAAQEIVDGIQLANLLQPQPDVVVVGRGGGSQEDLWSFNEEAVVRAIAASEIPVVSAVGHEVDVTLSDFVADVRALTPTAAAEIVMPSADEVASSLNQFRIRLVRSLWQQAEGSRVRLAALAQRPVMRQPLLKIRDLEQRLDDLSRRAERSVQSAIERDRKRLDNDAARLHGLSPTSILRRGYSVIQDSVTGRTIVDGRSLHAGQSLTCRFALGSAHVTVEAQQE